MSTNSRKWPMWHPSIHIDFIRLGSVTTNHKNGLTEQLAVQRYGSTGPSRMLSIATEWCFMGYSREFLGTVHCTYGQLNTTIVLSLHNNALAIIVNIGPGSGLLLHGTKPLPEQMLTLLKKGSQGIQIIFMCKCLHTNHESISWKLYP